MTVLICWNTFDWVISELNRLDAIAISLLRHLSAPTEEIWKYNLELEKKKLHCLQTQHLGVLKKSLKSVRAFQAELQLGSVGF